MKKKKRYDSRKLGKSASGAEHVYRVRRRIVLLIWLLVCIGIGFFIYYGYSSNRMSDTSAKSINLSGDVSTGNELKDGVAFGPWKAK